MANGLVVVSKRPVGKQSNGPVRLTSGTLPKTPKRFRSKNPLSKAVRQEEAAGMLKVKEGLVVYLERLGFLQAGKITGTVIYAVHGCSIENQKLVFREEKVNEVLVYTLESMTKTRDMLKNPYLKQNPKSFFGAARVSGLFFNSRWEAFGTILSFSERMKVQEWNGKDGVNNLQALMDISLELIILFGQKAHVALAPLLGDRRIMQRIRNFGIAHIAEKLEKFAKDAQKLVKIGIVDEKNFLEKFKSSLF